MQPSFNAGQDIRLGVLYSDSDALLRSSCFLAIRRLAISLALKTVIQTQAEGVELFVLKWIERAPCAIFGAAVCSLSGLWGSGGHGAQRCDDGRKYKVKLYTRNTARDGAPRQAANGNGPWAWRVALGLK